MAINIASQSSLVTNNGKPIVSSSRFGTPIYSWTPPSDWIPITVPSPTEQKFVGLVAVREADNYISFTVTTSLGGTVRVDWGNGVVLDYASATQINYTLDWSTYSASTLTTFGYRQAVVTITPTNPGDTFIGIELNKRPAFATNLNYANPWLDIAISAPNVTTMSLGGASTSGIATVSNFMLARVRVVSHNLSTIAYILRNARGLRYVSIVGSGVITDATGAFQDCSSLQTLEFLDTSNVTNMTSMFSACANLVQLPRINTSNVTNMTSMFSNCTALIYAPWLDTSKVTNTNSMFSGCRTLRRVPKYDLSKVTTATSMFQLCQALLQVPAFNFSSLITGNSMFTSCVSLISVPDMNLPVATDINSMFSGCLSLFKLPDMNVPSATNCSSLFQGCTGARYAGKVTLSSSLIGVVNFNSVYLGLSNVVSFPEIINPNAIKFASGLFQQNASMIEAPVINMPNVTSAGSLFQNSTTLQKVTILSPMAAGYNSMFAQCSAIQEITVDLSLVPNNSGNTLGFNNSCYNLVKLNLTGNRWSLDLTNCKLGASSLNSLYTSLPALNPAITNAVGTAGVVTFTVGTSAIQPFVTGRTVSVTGVTPVAYNITGTIASVNALAGTFTITNAATGTYVSGGIASITTDRTITVTGNPGTATDSVTIATNKGWTVTG